MREIAVLGAGPHGRQIAALLGDRKLATWLFDDDGYKYNHAPILQGARHFPWVIGAAWPAVRRAAAEKCAESPIRPFERGNVFWPGSQIGNEVRIGQHVHIQWNAVVSHSCVIGDFVTICPGAVLSGEVFVDDDVFIGAGATVIHGGITIGKGATVGAGAVVINHVPPGATVVGVPAREVRKF